MIDEAQQQQLHQVTSLPKPVRSIERIFYGEFGLIGSLHLDSSAALTNLDPPPSIPPMRIENMPFASEDSLQSARLIARQNAVKIAPNRDAYFEESLTVRFSLSLFFGF